jgi:hypothetical protein
MFLKYKYVLFAILALVVIAVGWKWLHPVSHAAVLQTTTSTAQLTNTTSTSQTGTPYLPNLTTASSTPGEATYRTELRKAIQNFQNAKSFRASVTAGQADSEIDATLEFSKPDRFRGTIQSKGADTAEIVAVGDSLYMRVNDQQWVNLTKTASAKTIGETLKNALNGDSNLTNLGVDDTLPITKSHDDTNQCDIYQTTVKSSSGTTNTVSICVADGLPKTLDLETAQGPIHLRYYDYNTVFIIVKPI